MIILDEIKTIIEDTLGLEFIYESFLDLNEWLDDTPLPCVAVQRLVGGTLQNEAGKMKDSSEFLIMFIDETEFKIQALENQAIIDAQKALAISFIREVEKSSVITYEGSVRYDEVYDEFDINVTGITLRINLKEMAGSVPCFMEEVIQPSDFPSET